MKSAKRQSRYEDDIFSIIFGLYASSQSYTHTHQPLKRYKRGVKLRSPKSASDGAASARADATRIRSSGENRRLHFHHHHHFHFDRAKHLSRLLHTRIAVHECSCTHRVRSFVTNEHKKYAKKKDAYAYTSVVSAVILVGSYFAITYVRISKKKKKSRIDYAS